MEGSPPVYAVSYRHKKLVQEEDVIFLNQGNLPPTFVDRGRQTSAGMHVPERS